MDDLLTQASSSAYLVVLSGSAIGSMFKLSDNSLLIGRSDHADIQLDDPGVSRSHARIRQQAGGTVHIEDLASTNGTWINNERIRAHDLRDGDQIRIGSISILKFGYHNSLEERFQQQLYDSVTRDALTGAYNKRMFTDQLDKAFSHAVRHNTPLSLAVLDLDHFKQINDTHGHPAGDAVLEQFGALMRQAVRNEDLFCRVGGEEFAVIMRECPAEYAPVAAERFRAAVEAHRFRHGRTPIPVTVSVGVTTLEVGRHPTPAALYEEADQALYRAKRGGRNRVCGGPT